ncbi:MAG: hypothetical protein FJ272_00825, partial [Planctomycetes bacterium]|nr:hypothetical protein [Planctomycetota bacterium]
MVGLWIGFICFILLMLALDLGVFHRRAHEVRLKEALTWSGAWVATALLFNVFVYFIYEHQWFGVETTGHEPDGR